jgi:hypothetical protein
MGADIHMVLEKRAKVRDKEAWIGVNAFPYLTVQVHQRKGSEYVTSTGSANWLATDRNYALFSALAGVRGPGPDAKGVPDDASDLALMMIDGWAEDGHSHSWMLMDEALPLFVMHGQFGDAGEAVLTAMKAGTWAALEQSFGNFWDLGSHYEQDADGEVEVRDKLTDFRLVYWFDN